MITIREMQSSDVDAMLKLRLQWLSKKFKVPKTTEKVRAWFSRYPVDPKAFALVALEDEQVVGYVLSALMIHPAAQGVSAEIDEVCVAETHRREGIGRRLVSVTREQLLAAIDDLNTIRVRVDREDDFAIAFLQALGFEHDVLEYTDYLD